MQVNERWLAGQRFEEIRDAVKTAARTPPLLVTFRIKQQLYYHSARKDGRTSLPHNQPPANHKSNGIIIITYYFIGFLFFCFSLLFIGFVFLLFCLILFIKWFWFIKNTCFKQSLCCNKQNKTHFNSFRV